MIQPIQIEIDDNVLIIVTGEYRGCDFGRLERVSDGYKVYSFDDKLDFYTADYNIALTWAVGNAYRYVAHRMKNG